ncbi:ankyrin repeat-containing domain protein [Trichoderma sp. SZMC 28014]
MARLLLEKGASPNVQGLDGTAPIHVAARERHFKIIEILIEFEADVDIVDGTGKTALHYAASNKYEEIVELLRQHGSQKTMRQTGKNSSHQ